jgi:hypothetical protein
MPDRTNSGAKVFAGSRTSEFQLSRPETLTLAAIVVAFAAIRFAGLFNDLWFDEIWSIAQIAQIGSPVEIFTRLQQDNNHPLNSLFLYWLTPAQFDWSYRLLSWFTGSWSVWLAGRIAGRQFRRLHPDLPAEKATSASLLTACLFGGSYFLIHYSSEARGYAPAACFSLLAWDALLGGSQRSWSGWVVIYWLACPLALLSHLSAAAIIPAGLAWAVTQDFSKPVDWRGRLAGLVRWHALPCIFLGVYWLGFARKIEVGGGPDNPLMTALGDMSAYSLGFPEKAGVLLALPVFLMLALLGLGQIWRQSERALFWFYATAIPLPFLALVSSRFVLIHSRYFFVSTNFALLLAGYALARAGNRGPRWRLVSLAALALFLVGNAIHVRRLLLYGRGEYQAAIRYIADHSPASIITVSSDFDFRNLGLIAYYGRAAGPARSVRYYNHDQWSPAGPQWLIFHRPDGKPPPAGGQADCTLNGHHFRLDRVFPHAALSGWDWFVYRNVDLIP